MEEKGRIELSKKVVFGLGDRDIVVYPATFEQILEISPKLEKLKTTTDLAEQVSLFVDVVYALIKDKNTVTKEEIRKNFSMAAGSEILKASTGSSM